MSTVVGGGSGRGSRGGGWGWGSTRTPCASAEARARSCSEVIGQLGGAVSSDLTTEGSELFSNESDNLSLMVSWGSVVGLVIIVPMFVAFAVMIGLQNSIRSKGTIGSIIAAIAVMFVTFGVVGFCGVLGGRSIPFVGPAINSLSPFNIVVGGIFPESIFLIDDRSFDLASMNLSLVIGAAVAAAIYAGLVFGMHASMKKSFMMTVRRLAGTR